VDARVSISKDKHGAHTRTHFPKRQQRQNVEEQRFTQLLRAADGPLSAMMAMPLYSSVARALGKRHQRCMQGLMGQNKQQGRGLDTFEKARTAGVSSSVNKDSRVLPAATSTAVLCFTNILCAPCDGACVVALGCDQSASVSQRSHGPRHNCDEGHDS